MPGDRMSRTQRNAPIRTWEAGDLVQGFALLTKKELRQDRNGKSYLDLEIADASGSMPAKIWADSPALNGQFELHHFIAFRGSVKSYKDQLQVAIDECREATDEDRRQGFDPALLIPSTREDIDDLWRRLRELLHSRVERPVLRRLAAEALAAYGKELREHPAAKSIHHAYRGGLIEHVVSMAELALRLCDHYRDLDRDLLVLGVLFHDLGKLRELGAMPVNDYTLEGRLVGHVVLGRDLLRERCAAIEGFPEDLRLLLEHMVLSHQGRKEFSSPVEPMTPEALALHFLDDLDSKLNQLRIARESSTGIVYHRGLARFVYLPILEPAADDREEPGLVVEVAQAAHSHPFSAAAPAGGTAPGPAAQPCDSAEPPPQPDLPLDLPAAAGRKGEREPEPDAAAASPAAAR
jgi:3'-5' exoribonuclease